MAFQQGFQKKVLINDVRYSATYIMIDAEANDLPITNSEGVTGASLLHGIILGTAEVNTVGRLSGNREATVTIRNASFDPVDGANPFAAPFFLAEGDYIKLQVFMADIGSQSWLFPSLLVLKINDTTDVKGLCPITMTAKSDGGYRRPNA